VVTAGLSDKLPEVLLPQPQSRTAVARNKTGMRFKTSSPFVELCR